MHLDRSMERAKNKKKSAWALYETTEDASIIYPLNPAHYTRREPKKLPSGHIHPTLWWRQEDLGAVTERRKEGPVPGCDLFTEKKEAPVNQSQFPTAHGKTPSDHSHQVVTNSTQLHSLVPNHPSFSLIRSQHCVIEPNKARIQVMLTAITKKGAPV